MKQQYTKPTLVPLGSVRELTLANGSGNGGGSQKSGKASDTGNAFPTKKGK